MGFFDILKKSKKQVIRENQSQGRDGEEQARREYEFSGHDVEKIHRGGDLKVTKRDWLTGRKGKPKIVEVKTGNSKLSKLQKKRQRQYGDRYVVKRYESTPLGLIPKSNPEDSNARKRSSGYDSMFGLSGSSKPSRRKSSSGYDSMFGLGGSSGNKRRKSSSGFW